MLLSLRLYSHERDFNIKEVVKHLILQTEFKFQVDSKRQNVIFLFFMKFYLHKRLKSFRNQFTGQSSSHPTGIMIARLGTSSNLTASSTPVSVE